MSLNIGENMSRYVSVYNPQIRLAYSDKVVFAELSTSNKNFVPVVDDAGAPVIDPETKEQQMKTEYINSRWNARFVGEAAEMARTLKNGSKIDIVKGWVENKEDKERWRTYLDVYISSFVMSELSASTPDA